MYSLPGNNLSLNSVVDYLWSEAVGGRTKQAYNTGMRCFRTFLALDNLFVMGQYLLLMKIYLSYLWPIVSVYYI